MVSIYSTETPDDHRRITRYMFPKQLRERISFLNHLFPVLGNTIVKPFFTLAMFYGTIPLFSLIVCTCDIMSAYWHPMIGDNVVGPLRQCMLMYTITTKINASISDWIIFLSIFICKCVYTYERRTRVNTGSRHEFGPLHHFEHVGLYIYFLRFLGRIDVYASLYRLGGLLVVCLVVLPSGMFYLVNLYIRHHYIERIPHYFDRRLMMIYTRKVNANTTSSRVGNYLIAALSYRLNWDVMTWRKIEEMTDALIARIRPFHPDLVVGICSGGAFITPYVQQAFTPCPDTMYVSSKTWSNVNYSVKLQAAIDFYTNKQLYLSTSDDNGLVIVVPPSRNTYKRILIIDDSVNSGRTMTRARAMVTRMFPESEVRTCVLICAPDAVTIVDTVVYTRTTPCIWEWGVELD